MNDLRGVIGITTRLRKIMSGEDSAMRSARGHLRIFLGCERL